MFFHKIKKVYSDKGMLLALNIYMFCNFSGAYMDQQQMLGLQREGYFVGFNRQQQVQFMQRQPVPQMVVMQPAFTACNTQTTLQYPNVSYGGNKQ